MVNEQFNLSGVDDFLALERHAIQSPAGVALAVPGRVPLTYQKLRDTLQAARRTLADAGLRTGEIGALVLPNGPELITAFLAISCIGAGAPLNPALTEDEYRFYLSRLGARILIVPDGLVSPAATAARVLGIPVLRIRSSWNDAAGGFTLGGAEKADREFSVRTTDAALLLFTSATTGAPKLVPLTWGNLHAMAVRETHALQLTNADRFLSLMPLFHLHGLAAVLAQLHCGGTVISTQGFNPATFLNWLDEFRPTWFTSSPPLNRAILTLARAHPEVFRRIPLRVIRSTGAAPESEQIARLEQAAGVPVLAGYGLTETGGVTRETPDACKPGSAGRSSGLEVAIMDPLDNVLAAGLEGEIAVRGASVTSGYLDDPEANQAAFRDGWFHTGDIGRLDGEGFLFITGRLREIINRGGEKIVPQEVDKVLAAHPALADAAAFAVAHRTLGEDVAAAVVLRTGATASELELRRFAATRLARFKVPRRIVFMDAIPRTATGKAQRGVLAEQFRSRALSHREPSSPLSETVQARAACAMEQTRAT
jgi:acyl-CoA synthetase (AMP-forming)/AMP-acid ligase II